MFVLKNDSQVMFSTPWGPKGLKRVKNANFKIFPNCAKFGHFWQNCPYPHGGKSRVLDPEKIFLLKVSINSACPKTSLGHVLGFPRDRGQRNSPQRIKSLFCTFRSNLKNFLRALFVLKNDSQVMFSTPWGPKGLKRVKNANFKIFQNCAKFGHFWQNCPYPHGGKSRVLDPEKIFLLKVSINLAWPKTSPGTRLRLPKGQGTKK